MRVVAINKKALSEEDIKMKYITPAIDKAGWDIKAQVRAEYSFTDGKKESRLHFKL